MDLPPQQEEPHLHDFHTNLQNTLDYVTLVTDYISLPICLAAIVADIILIIMIIKFKVLRTRSNYFIFNYAFFNLFYILSTPIFFIIMDLIAPGWIGVAWYCTMVQIQNLTISLNLTFIFMLLFDGFLETYYRKRFSFYFKYYKLFFIPIYAVHFILYLTIASFCFRRGNNNISYVIVTVYYFCLLLGAGVLNFVHYRRIKQSSVSNTTNLKYSLPTANVVILFWLPLFLYYILMWIFRNYRKVTDFIWITAFIPEYISYASSIVLLYILVKYHKYFRLAFYKIFNRKGENLDFDRLDQYPEETFSNH